MAAKVEALFTVPPDEVARALPEEERIDGFEMAQRLSAARDKIQHIEIYTNQVNYAYWNAGVKPKRKLPPL